MLYTLLYLFGLGLLINCGYLTYKFFTDDVNADGYYTVAKVQLGLSLVILITVLGLII